MFQGTFTALVTPFRNGSVDWESLEKLVASQIAAGVEGVVPCGTTGESPTLDHDEHKKVVEFVVSKAKGRTKVVAGTGSNSTAETLELSSHAEKCGADGLLLVCPYYNKPTPEGLYRHFKAVNDAVGLPQVVYNVPGRSAVKIGTDTLKRLTDLPRVAAVKDATGDIDMASETVALCGDRLDVLSGNDSMTLPMIAIGGKGVISVLSNLDPSRVKKMVDFALAGNVAEARKLHLQLWDVGKTLFVETNPIPVKAGAYLLGLIADEEIRLPLVKLEGANRRKLVDSLAAAGLKPVRS